eukprot:Awhi_evm1s9501
MSLRRVFGIPFRERGVNNYAKVLLKCRTLSTKEARNKVAVIMGAGDATGGAIARKFAQEGFTVCVARRNFEKLSPLVDELCSEGLECLPFGVDGRKEDEVVEFINKIENDIGPIHVGVHNIGANVRFSVVDTTAQVYRKVWEMACFSAFLFSREIAKKMIPRKEGSILVTGATASIRGNPNYCAFAGAKHAKRALTQSLSKELGPQGIHVSHVIIDGVIDTK